MDDWDLDPPPQKKARSFESQSTDSSAAPIDPKTGPGPSAPTVEPYPRGIEADARGAEPGGPSSPMAARRRARIPLSWVTAGLALLLIGLLAGFFIARSQAGDDAAQLVATRQELGTVQRALSHAEERNWNYYRETEALKAEIEGLRPTTTEDLRIDRTGVPQVFFPGSYGDGIYLVGEDIPVGTYDGEVGRGQGYWARLSGTDGLVSEIVANGIPTGPFVLTIVESDKAVELRGVTLTAR
jgi:hypothetical protein